VIEVTPEETRFVPVNMAKRNMLMLGAGILVGGLILGRK